MTTAADVKSWWDKYEAASQISKRTGTAFDAANLLQIALDRGVRFVVNVPTGTKDVQDRPMPGGLWELMVEGKFGTPGRQEIEREINPNISVEGIKGAWVGRPGDEQRELRPGGWPNRSYGALPNGCTLGLRRQVVEDLAETLNKELAKQQRRQVVESVIEGDALPTPAKAAEQLDPRERQTYLKLIAGLALHGRFTEFTGAAFAQVTDLIGGKHGVSVNAATEKINQLYDEAEEKGWDRRLPPRARAKKKTKSGQR